MTNHYLKKSSDENMLEYQLRVFRNKDAYGATWEEICAAFNRETGEKWSESKYRKFLSAFNKGYEFAKRQNLSDNEILREIQNEQHKLIEERKKLQSVRVDYNKTIREKSRRDLIFEHVKDSIKKIPVPEFNTEFIHSQDSDRHGVLSFGDIHFGKEFKSLNNEYSEEIAKERMQNLIAETVKIIKKEGFTHIDVINGADSIEGMNLRISQLQSLSIGFIDQTIKFAKFIASWLNELSKYVSITYRHVPSANHSELRPHNSKRGEFPAEDLEKVIMHYVHDVLEDNNRIEVPIYDKGIIDFNILDYNVVALHGHQIKGTKNVIKDLSMLHRKFYDYCYIYHYHHGNALTVGQGVDNNVEIIQTPSIMGSDEYSDSLMISAKPGANFSIFERGKGRTISYNILLK